LGFCEISANVGIGLVLAQSRATTRIASTKSVNPLNSQGVRRYSSSPVTGLVVISVEQEKRNKGFPLKPYRWSLELTTGSP